MENGFAKSVFIYEDMYFLLHMKEIRGQNRLDINLHKDVATEVLHLTYTRTHASANISTSSFVTNSASTSVPDEPSGFSKASTNS